jgi:hypothetical protein
MICNAQESTFLKISLYHFDFFLSFGSLIMISKLLAHHVGCICWLPIDKHDKHEYNYAINKIMTPVTPSVNWPLWEREITSLVILASEPLMSKENGF